MAKTLESAILEQVRQLDTLRQAQVLRYLQALTAQQSSQAWLNFVEACAAELRAKYGETHSFDSLSSLDESREERLDDLLGGN
ncbi:MAG: hypothetical protein DYG88_02020 [Chloroflexi bacterium CFX4]|nr:hypothetical protein [Chloroflexi bacterium CFX4]MDL1922429.1 hypothetical protein [Chloroflexi bacterium CFX3]